MANKRETLKEDWEGEEVNEEDLASRPSKQTKKLSAIAAKTEGPAKVDHHRFESSNSAMPAGKTDQGATVDTIADKAEASQQQKESKRAG